MTMSQSWSPLIIIKGDRTNLSSRFIDALDPNLIQSQFYETEQDSFEAVLNGSASLSITIPDGLCEYLQLRAGLEDAEYLNKSFIYLLHHTAGKFLIIAICFHFL